MLDSLGADYFRGVYENSDDPWQFTTSPYENSKYEDTLASLPRPAYREALEIGCSIGVFTERLAPRCRRLLATDVSSKALASAKVRCREWPNVTFERSAMPADELHGCFDLIVLSEVGYYWSRPDLEKAADRICAHLTSAGELILVHWLPFVADYPLTGDAVHDYFLERKDLRHLHGHRREKYRLDVFQKARSPWLRVEKPLRASGSKGTDDCVLTD